MNLKKVAIVSGSVLIIVVGLYFRLGGFNKVTYSLRSGATYKIIGKSYSGKNNTVELESLFTNTKNLIRTDFPSGILVIVNNLMDVDNEQNLVGYFVGILVEEFPRSVPAGYSVRTYGSDTIITATIDAHNLVMPKPEQVRRNAEELARSENLELSYHTIEKYLEEGLIEVDFLTEK